MTRFPMPTALLATLSALLLIAALVLSGCGDDKPYSSQPPGSGQTAASPTLAPLAAALPSPPSAQAPNPLLSGNGQADNPLLSSPGGGNPLTQNNPLASRDPLHGPAMPTDHSHWLRGRVRDARLTVLLNGVRQGEYTGVVDQDITMKLRRGVNSVSFVYAPRGAEASAQMDLLESEHNPPIPPLVTFQSAPSQDAAVPESASSSAPATQRFTFFAR